MQILTKAYNALGSKVKRNMRESGDGEMASSNRLRRIFASFTVRIIVALSMHVATRTGLCAYPTHRYIGWLLVGAAIFSHTEKDSKSIDDGAPWSFSNGVYFAYVASSTIGTLAFALFATLLTDFFFFCRFWNRLFDNHAARAPDLSLLFSSRATAANARFL